MDQIYPLDAVGETAQAVEDTVQSSVDWLSGYVPPVLWPWLIIGLGIVLAVSLHAALWRGVTRALRGRGGLAVSVVRRLRRPTRLFLLVGAFNLLVKTAGLSTGWRAALDQGSVAFLIVIVGWVVIVGLDTAAERFAGRLKLDVDDNVAARAQVTQIRMMQRIGRILIGLLTAALVLSTFEAVRNFGVSLFASAGAAGLVLGFAAQPVLANLIAGIQIAITQPIRIDDVVIVEDEWGWIEEIAATYVVIRIWDLRRLVVPLSYFIEKPFQNWTRDSGTIIGAVNFHLDYTAPIAALREKMEAAVRASERWDGKVVNMQVIETTRDTVEVRGLMSAKNSPTAWELRCEVREAVLEWLQAEHPGALPKVRTELKMEGAPRGNVMPMRPEGEAQRA